MPWYNVGNVRKEKSGRNSAVECQLPKLDVGGSSPLARSTLKAKRLGQNPGRFFACGNEITAWNTALQRQPEPGRAAVHEIAQNAGGTGRRGGSGGKPVSPDAPGFGHGVCNFGVRKPALDFITVECGAP